MKNEEPFYERSVPPVVNQDVKVVGVREEKAEDRVRWRQLTISKEKNQKKRREVFKINNVTFTVKGRKHILSKLNDKTF